MGTGTAMDRTAFAERVRRANYLEYWMADYRTNKPETGVVPCLWAWAEMKELMLESERLIGINEAERRGLIQHDLRRRADSCSGRIGAGSPPYDERQPVFLGRHGRIHDC
jgi:gentisate 1,2-dioxygenase